jgi:hypothetical protein
MGRLVEAIDLQSICEFNTEKEHFQPSKDLSTTHKVRKSEHFHQHGEISRVTKVFTNDSNPTSDPGHYEWFQHYSLTQVQTTTAHCKWEKT